MCGLGEVMPIRHPNHELEDASRRAFDSLLPLKWVPRVETPDYGVDLNVEIFNAKGEATGLFFGVQLRATSAKSRKNKVSIEIDRLQYFASRETPTIIVRYYQPTDTFFWTWASDVGSEVLSSENSTATLNFVKENEWTSSTPDKISRALGTRRAMLRLVENGQIIVEATVKTLDLHERFDFESAIRRSCEKLSWLENRPSISPSSPVVDIIVTSSTIELKIEGLRSIEFEMIEFNSTKIEANLFYGLASLLWKSGITAQARECAMLALSSGVAADSPELAATTCQVISKDIPKMVSLAVLNGFHHMGSIYHIMIALMMRHSGSDSKAALKSGKTFYLLSSKDAEPASRSAAHYNYANFCRSADSTLDAVHHYNQARKILPEYADRPYWRRELAGCLYIYRHYKPSEQLYASSITEDSNDIDLSCWADALMFSGKIAKAEAIFKKSIALSNDLDTSEPAELKRSICEKMTMAFGAEAPRAVAQANLMLRETSHTSPEFLEKCEHIVMKVDAFNALANFNYGIQCSQLDKAEDAWLAFAICGIQCPNDSEAWKNLLICALIIGSKEVLFNSICTAVCVGGHEVYSIFRNHIAEQGAEDPLIATLDELYRKISESI